MPATNPAKELLALFETWSSRPGRADTQRKLGEPEGIEEICAAVRHLLALCEVLESLSGAGHEMTVYKDA